MDVGTSSPPDDSRRRRDRGLTCLGSDDCQDWHLIAFGRAPGFDAAEVLVVAGATGFGTSSPSVGVARGAAVSGGSAVRSKLVGEGVAPCSRLLDPASPLLQLMSARSKPGGQLVPA